MPGGPSEQVSHRPGPPPVRPGGRRRNRRQAEVALACRPWSGAGRGRWWPGARPPRHQPSILSPPRSMPRKKGWWRRSRSAVCSVDHQRRAPARSETCAARSRATPSARSSACRGIRGHHVADDPPVAEIASVVSGAVPVLQNISTPLTVRDLARPRKSGRPCQACTKKEIASPATRAWSSSARPSRRAQKSRRQAAPGGSSCRGAEGRRRTTWPLTRVEDCAK